MRKQAIQIFMPSGLHQWAFHLISQCLSLSTWRAVIKKTCLLSWHACVHAKSLQWSPTLWSYGLPTRLLCPCNSPDKNTGMGCHSLLQGIVQTHGSNLGLLWLLHCRQILDHWATTDTHLGLNDGQMPHIFTDITKMLLSSGEQIREKEDLPV